MAVTAGPVAGTRPGGMAGPLSARIRLAVLPTPLVAAPHLGEAALLPRCTAGENVVFWHTGGLLDVVAAAMEDRR